MSDRGPGYWDALSEGDPDAAVLDPADRRGFKNRYIAMVRDRAIADSLSRLGRRAALLDFGCGSGSTSPLLERFADRVVGIDISRGLLHRAVRRPGLSRTAFVHYDGHRMPLAQAAFDAVVIYVVLSYVDDDTARRLLGQLHAVTRPGGSLVMIEQTVRRPRVVEQGLKHLRHLDAWRGLLAHAGWRLDGTRQVRFGRFPTTPLIRAGAVPVSAFPALCSLEDALGRRMGPLPHDYAETLFEATA